MAEELVKLFASNTKGCISTAFSICKIVQKIQKYLVKLLKL